MSTFISIFILVFIVLFILVMIFDRKPSEPVADSEPKPVNVMFDVIAPTSSAEMLRIIEVVKDGEKLQLKRESEDDTIPASVLVFAPDGTVIGRVEKPYSLSFYTEIDCLMDCEAVSVLLGAQLHIRARAVFKPGSYIWHVDI